MRAEDESGGRIAMMNIYFSCSLTGGRADQQIYAAIVDHLQNEGHEVPTAHLAHPEVMDLEAIVDPFEIYARDIDWIDACDGLIAEVSTPSHGVGYEIAYALSIGKPVLCCYRNGAAVSKMLTGNVAAGFQITQYDDEGQVIALVNAFIAGLASEVA